MSFWSILLRLLLGLSLVLNGVTSAAAAIHLPAGHADMRATAMETAKVSPGVAGEMPCHPPSDGGVAVPHQGSPAAIVDVSFASSGHPVPDCCEAGTCRCACVHVAQAIPPDWNLGSPAIHHARSARPLTLAHAAPALPHLIRPPIG